MGQNGLDTNTLENWLWEAACKIRGDVDAPKYKDYILSLVFLKRLSDGYDDELRQFGEEQGVSESDVESELAKNHALVRFYLSEKALVIQYSAAIGG